MGLSTGARVGDYEIKGSLGRGGMSEVYRARDRTLGRDVAIKVLPRTLATDDEKRARFEREAQLLAALTHKNIAVIHGLEQDAGTWFLVLELIEGQTLAERIQSENERLGLDEVRAIFVQIAQALEAAHVKGIIHRDLKPSNVKIADDGTVKLLDFGLGKELPKSGPSRKETATFDGLHTSPGLVMGTPGYMSPEQTRGQETAEATDIWSFGVTLFEALAGVHPFARETIPDMLSAILNDEPPWDRLPEHLPREWQRVLKRTLSKDPRDRFHAAADVRIELEDAPTELSQDRTPSDASSITRMRSSVPGSWVLIALAVLIPLLVWNGSNYLGSAPAQNRVARRFVVDLPPTAPIALDGTPALTVSPDGTLLVYSSKSSNRSQLHLRAFDQLGTVAIPGTQGGTAPFFSPTSGALGFFTETQLATLSLPGGTPVPLTESSVARGASWTDGRGILFAATSNGGLSRISVQGGRPEAITSPEADGVSHRWPQVLPDGSTALVTLWSRDGVAIGIVDLASGQVERLIDNGTFGRYAPSGHLVFARDGSLYAVGFDPGAKHVRGEPLLVMPDIAHDRLTGAAYYALANDGALFYVASENELSSPTRMLSVERDGSATPLGPPRASIQVPRWSPDGRFVLATVQSGDTTDIWSFNVERGALTRLTFDGSSAAAVWHPSGSRVAYSTSGSGSGTGSTAHAIEAVASDGSGTPERLVVSDLPLFPTSYSRDGAQLAYTQLAPETGLDIWLWRKNQPQPELFLGTAYSEAGARFSPDGTLLAYTSDESGRDEVYVRAVGKATGRWQVSTRSGNEPSWSRDGSELFFRSGTSLMVAEVTSGPGFDVSAPRALFEAPFDTAGSLYANYDASPDGRSFVMIRGEENTAADRIHVVLYWLDELKRRIPRP